MIRLSIRRPVAVAMAYFAVALLGVAAWRNIAIELLPDTQLPRLTVTARWPGSSPETVEAFLTSPIESTIQQVRGVEKITSESFEERGSGTSSIQVEFDRDTDMDFARLDLSERLATLEEDLPPGVGPIQVAAYVPREFQTQAERRFLSYTFTGPFTLEWLREYLEEEVVPELTEIEGVALVNVHGGQERLIEIEMDQDRITSLGLTPQVVYQRISDLDLVREAGAVRDREREWVVTIRNRPSSVQDIRSAVVTAVGGRLIRVSDVAVVRDSFEEAWSYYRINGRPAVAFSVLKEVDANTVRVADRVKARMADIEARRPSSTRYIMNDDESEDIKKQLTDLRYRALIAAGVIFIVLLIFLRSFRSAGVIFATIAFSVLIALNLVYFGGLSLNLLTLMGLALGFGLVVDNSIVVLENIYRRWQRGEAPAEAAEKGAGQVVLPILTSTATTLIVFVPFVYLQGELRVFYVPLAIVVGLTLLASLFVAFTFIPALAAKLLDVGRGPSLGQTISTEAGAEGGARAPIYVRFYRGLVGMTLRHPWVVVCVAAAALGGSYYLFDKYVNRGVIWGGGWGQDTYIDIRITLPRGSDLSRTDELVRHFEDRLAVMPEVEKFESNVFGQYGFIQVIFPDSLELTSVPVAIKEQMVAYSLGYSGAQVRVYGFGPSFYGGGSSPPNYSITVLGYNYERVRDIAEDLGGRLTNLSRIRDVNTNSSGAWYERDRATEFMVTVDRDALARYDMSVNEFIWRFTSLVSGEARQDQLKIGGEEVRYEVKVEGYRDIDVQALNERIITGAAGLGIRVGDVVTVEPKEILARIRREDQQYERLVTYEFRGPRKLGDMVHEAVIEATSLPPGYTVKKADSWRWSDEEREQIYLVLAISVILIYMVTSALFESMRQPLCVLLTVPMALIGVFLIFFYTNASFTREAYIGVIMMGGIVVNNAILLVDHINRVRRESGQDLVESILQGTLERVRPILMTATTTVLGLLPLVVMSEGGTEGRIWNALGYALIGGLLSSTLFVLTTTPALYFLFERGKTKGKAAVEMVPAPAFGLEPEPIGD